MRAQHKRFVHEYLIDLSAKEAAIRAGYSVKNAAALGCRMLARPDVQSAIAARQGKIIEKLEITQERVLNELAKIGFANMADYMRVGPDGDPYLDWSNLTRDQAAALSEVTVEDFKDGRGEEGRDVRRVKFKLAEKRSALVDLGKHLGMFKDKIDVQHSGDMGLVHRIELIGVEPNADGQDPTPCQAEVYLPG